ncbi:MAG: hypothetical protein MASP_01605 [Candidatus Methanolliviera sp. GoM_asphalt]|nr:MAG: hypothetical protein MASP_01605 [Candidatus Methanolliviera sp. GoM_asphalt]
MVYKQKWRREDAKNTLNDYIDLDTILFLDQTKKVTKLGLEIGAIYGLGGRDSLILANFITNSIERMITSDRELLEAKIIQINERELEITEMRSLLSEEEDQR